MGAYVVATEEITEEEFNGTDAHVHASKGDIGKVVQVASDGSRTVQFTRTGTATLVDESQVLDVTEEFLATLARLANGWHLVGCENADCPGCHPS